MPICTTEKIHSPGKLLLTGEYFVLDGAEALAIPTKVGQSLACTIGEKKQIVSWKTFIQGEFWFSVEVNYKNWEIIETNLLDKAEFILKILKIIQGEGRKFQGESGFSFEANVEFPSNYGLGSSSTLMVNLAQWAGIDPFELNEKALGGSGYDVAVAVEKSSIVYQLKENDRVVSCVDFSPSFKDELIFIHLNQKQDSREGIKLYRSKSKLEGKISEISGITRAVLEAKTLSDFSDLMVCHEGILSKFLELKTAKEKLFPDCPSFVKSLGAWGGDFVMSSKFAGYKEYFSEKGFETILHYGDLIG